MSTASDGDEGKGSSGLTSQSWPANVLREVQSATVQSMLGTHAASVALKQVAEIMNLEVARSDVTDLGSWVDLMRSTASLMAEKASLILSVADDWRVTADKLAPYA